MDANRARVDGLLLRILGRVGKESCHGVGSTPAVVEAEGLRTVYCFVQSPTGYSTYYGTTYGACAVAGPLAEAALRSFYLVQVIPVILYYFEV